ANLTIEDGSEVNDLGDGHRPVHTFTVTNTFGTASATLDVNSTNAPILVGDAQHSLESTDNLSVNGAVGTTLTLDHEAANRSLQQGDFSFTLQDDPGSPSYQITGAGVTRQNHATVTITAGGMVLGTRRYDSTNKISYSNLSALTVQGGSGKS